MPVILDPTAYVENGAMDRLIGWAVRQVNRHKLDLVVPTCSHGVVDDKATALTYEAALGMLAAGLKTDLTNGLLLPGQSVTVGLGACPEIQFDADAQVYWFDTPASVSSAQKVWLENASSVARKLTYVTRYALNGACLDDALDADNDADVLPIVQRTPGQRAAGRAAVRLCGHRGSAAGVQVAQLVSSLADADLVWTAPNNPGNYVIRAGLSDDGGRLAC